MLRRILHMRAFSSERPAGQLQGWHLKPRSIFPRSCETLVERSDSRRIPPVGGGGPPAEREIQRTDGNASISRGFTSPTYALPKRRSCPSTARSDLLRRPGGGPAIGACTRGGRPGRPWTCPRYDSRHGGLVLNTDRFSGCFGGCGVRRKHAHSTPPDQLDGVPAERTTARPTSQCLQPMGCHGRSCAPVYRKGAGIRHSAAGPRRMAGVQNRVCIGRGRASTLGATPRMDASSRPGIECHEPRRLGTGAARGSAH